MHVRALTRLIMILLLALPGPLSAAARETSAQRGEYLVSLLGCGRCHTEGYLIGNGPSGPHLAGSRIGIAYAGADDEIRPGLVFAPNLTPDRETGIGTWTRRDITRALTTGVGTDGHQRLPVMPWPNYGALTDRDLTAIADYLQSIPAVRRSIPATTAPGDPVQHPYVRFGIFVFAPADDPAVD
jgi:mono/diheme cytochrome c family protein